MVRAVLLAPLYSQFSGRKGKYNINYFVDGADSSAPVLLVHGFGASIGHWRKNIPFFLEAGYQVYAVDLIGFGASEKPLLEEYSLDIWKELLLDFCNVMQPKKVWRSDDGFSLLIFI